MTLQFRQRCILVSLDAVPAEALDAFWRYEDALLSNDRAALADLYADGEATVRGDGTDLLVGKEAISAFRDTRTSTPTRHVREVHVRVLAEGTVLIIASTFEPASGASGLQTQVWREGLSGWQVIASHVSVPPNNRVFDRTVWRVVGDPLLAATGSGSLSGLRIAMGDLHSTAGESMQSSDLAAWTRGTQAPVAASAVNALLAVGATVIGIVRAEEPASGAHRVTGSHVPPPENSQRRRDRNHIPARGYAGPVALGQADLGLGTDTGGKIRVAASGQGLVGVRSTHGIIDRLGLLHSDSTFDAVSWVTRDVATSIRVADVLLAHQQPSAPLRKTLWPQSLLNLPGREVASAFGSRTEELIGAGALPTEADFELSREQLET